MDPRGPCFRFTWSKIWDPESMRFSVSFSFIHRGKAWNRVRVELLWLVTHKFFGIYVVPLATCHLPLASNRSTRLTIFWGEIFRKCRELIPGSLVVKRKCYHTKCGSQFSWHLCTSGFQLAPQVTY